LDLVRAKAEDLFDFCLDVLKHAEVKEDDAKIIAENLVMANLRGVDSHGVARLMTYVERVTKGLIDPRGPIEVVREYGDTALIDAHNNFGQIAAMRATHLAAEKARRFGVSFVGVRNSNHFGMAAYYALKLTDQKLIGIVSSNGPPAIAPWGGKTPMLGTNPICVGFPADKNDSIILDMATSIVARGKIRLAALKKEKIPEGWAFDEEGNPTSDPKAALKGSLAPIAGPKGYGLALSLDIICGLLTGSKFLQDVKALDDFSGTSGTGCFIQAINIEAFVSYQQYLRNVMQYVKEIKDSPKKIGANEIFLPGEIERKELENRSKLGIPLNQEVLNELRKLAKKFGVEFFV
jgi:LDH2 family malate/lactate/ureidoglycolate dehydrogenase